MNKKLFIFYDEEENRALFIRDFKDDQAVRSFINTLISSEKIRKIMYRYATNHGIVFEFHGEIPVTDFLKNEVSGTKFIFDSTNNTYEISSNEISVKVIPNGLA